MVRTCTFHAVLISPLLLLSYMQAQSVRPLPYMGTSKASPKGYLDLLSNAKGYNHIAYFPSPDAHDPIFLTEGEWEVVSIESVDVSRGLM
jgi:dipeptidyl aminopeptidase B